MHQMWAKRLVGATVVAILAAVATVIGVRGYEIYVYEVIAVPLALIVGEIVGGRIHSRQSRRLN